VVDEWMSMEQRLNDTNRGNRNTGRKTLQRMVCRRMDKYGANWERYWLGKM